MGRRPDGSPTQRATRADFTTSLRKDVLRALRHAPRAWPIGYPARSTARRMAATSSPALNGFSSASTPRPAAECSAERS
jgi:hypothetical protein